LSLPEVNKKTASKEYREYFLQVASKVHPDSFCLTCLLLDPDCWPSPCVYNKRWQKEGFCRARHLAENAAKKQVASNGQKEIDEKCMKEVK